MSEEDFEFDPSALEGEYSAPTRQRAVDPEREAVLAAIESRLVAAFGGEEAAAPFYNHSEADPVACFLPDVREAREGRKSSLDGLSIETLERAAAAELPDEVLFHAIDARSVTQDRDAGPEL